MSRASAPREPADSRTVSSISMLDGGAAKLVSNEAPTTNPSIQTAPYRKLNVVECADIVEEKQAARWVLKADVGVCGGVCELDISMACGAACRGVRPELGIHCFARRIGLKEADKPAKREDVTVVEVGIECDAEDSKNEGGCDHYPRQCHFGGGPRAAA